MLLLWAGATCLCTRQANGKKKKNNGSVLVLPVSLSPSAFLKKATEEMRRWSALLPGRDKRQEGKMVGEGPCAAGAATVVFFCLCVSLPASTEI